MSIQRVAVPLASPAALISKFASSSTRPCQHLLRAFSSYNSYKSSSKRKMQTSTAYTQYKLEPPPPPPRNTGIPDTSIAGTSNPVHIFQPNDIRPPAMTQNNILFEEPESEPAEKISVTEQEAQISKPTAATTETAQTRPKARPKLRARKAAMSLTSAAVSQLRNLLSSPTPRLIKVGVRNRGCSGLAYHLEYVEKPGPFDEMVEQDGVKVLVDSKALFSIIGSEMDWVEDKLNQRFVFRNPNIKEECGCGESFMI